jgi:hypothetical protein
MTVIIVIFVPLLFVHNFDLTVSRDNGKAPGKQARSPLGVAGLPSHDAGEVKMIVEVK